MYCGFAILEFSKIVMYRYLYDHLYKIYDYKNVKLCYMDTDSFLISIVTNDFYKDMLNNNEEYDLSEYKNGEIIKKNGLARESA